ncbi:glycoside hydrolase family 2 protein [Pseudalkalibacillus hwajinpoensis]|uniref:glycoside hydrolase family 2 protein n=1 Tax=Guptibacillus hwajinpoensis TaxID=208199 RepID=UPI00325ACC54
MALDSEVMLHHQKNGRGNYLIKEYMETYLPEPKDFPSFLYMSQVLQAEGIKTAIEAHRRKKPYCMGTLYWQMNDCWPVASWASMDYYGRWKALHYYAKRSFQDIMLSIDGTKNTQVDLHIISDVLNKLQGSIHMKLLAFDGELLREWNEEFILEANSTSKFVTLATEEILEGRNPNEVVFKAELEIDGEITDAKYHYFTSVKNLSLSKPDVKIEEVVTPLGKEYILETDVLAKQVYVTSNSEGIFTDNYFVSGQQKRISFLARTLDEGFTEGFAESLQVHSMADL